MNSLTGLLVGLFLLLNQLLILYQVFQIRKLALGVKACHYPKLSRLAIPALRPERAVDISRWWNHR